MTCNRSGLFTDEQIRKGLPAAEGLGLKDLRWFA